MTALSDYLESGLLHHVFRGQSFPKPENIAIALCSGVPSESDSAVSHYKNGGPLPEIPSGDAAGNDTGYRRYNLGNPSTQGDSSWDYPLDGHLDGSGLIEKNMAILSRSDYIDNIRGILPDNSTQQISPLDLRTSLIDIVDSVHLFFDDKNIVSANFATPETRNTKAGIGSLSSINLAGRTSIDNTAIGYNTLRQNYSASGNTAVGSYSQSCNLYGTSNTSLGYLSLAGNTNGRANVALGSYTLHNNKTGSFNIAIGHGASWHIGPDKDYTFSVASFDVQSESFCDVDGNLVYTNPANPLLYGDLTPNNPKLAVGTDFIHEYGVLQVSGDCSPSLSGEFFLGKSQYPWAGINDEVFFSGKYVGVGGQPSGAMQGITGSAGC